MATKADAQKSRILDAFVGRLATTPFPEIDLADVASDAGVSLADLRGQYDGTLDLLDAFNRKIDMVVLGRDDPAMTDEAARERLFDVLMRRFDALAPHREAVRLLDRSVRRDPLLALAVAPGVVRSMEFMLAAARIPAGGTIGLLRAPALALAWSRMVPAWLGDTDAGLARTMVAVDRELQRCERAERLGDRLGGLVGRLVPRPSSRRTDNVSDIAGEGI
jgi:hypothetical protein